MKKKQKTPKTAVAVEPIYLQVANLIGGEPDIFSDGSGSWIEFKYGKKGEMQVVMSFSGDGNKFLGFKVCRDIYDVVDNEIVIHLEKEE
jgi:hypothetical protein